MLQYRFPGGGFPFGKADQEVYFGREDAIKYVFNNIFLNQCVVIYGKSGVGKSSLLQAGVMPKLLRNNVGSEKSTASMRVFYIRPGIWQKDDKQTLIEKIVDLINQEESETPPPNSFLQILPEEIRKSLWYRIKCLQYSAEKAGRNEINLLVMDQVEEFFTYTPTQLNEFINEIIDLRSEALPNAVRLAIEKYEDEKKVSLTSDQSSILYKSLPVKFIFSIRSDKLYMIGRLKSAIFNILYNTFEVFPLTNEQAKEAILKPSNSNGDYLSPKFDLSQVMNEIISFLLSLPRYDAQEDSQERRIDPFALQIICQHIERKLVIEQQVRVVTPDSLGSLNKILANFYLDTLQNLRLSDVMLKKVRELIEDKMVQDRFRLRNPVYKNVIFEDGIDKMTLDSLIDSRIIKETNPGSEQFEISHDVLLNAVLTAKAERKLQEEELKKKYDLKLRDANIPTESEVDEKIRQRPHDYTVYLEKAELLFDMGKYAPAAQTIEKAINLYGNYDEQMVIGLSNCYFALGDYVKSNDKCFEVISNNPKHTTALYYIAFNYGMLEDYANALKYYKLVLKNEPDNEAANFNLGRALQMSGQLNAAEEQYKKVINEYVDNLNFEFELIDVLIKNKKVDEAAERSMKFIENNSENAEILSKLGRIYMDNMKYEDAIYYYKKSLELNPTDHVSRADTGIVYSYLGKNEKAIQELKLACSLSKSNSFYHVWLGFLLQVVQRYDEALDVLKKAVKYDRKYRYARASLAACYRRMGNEKEYLKNVAKARTMNPDNEDHYSLASFEALCGNTEVALFHLEKVIKQQSRPKKFIQSDPDFEFIKKDRRFKALLTSYGKELVLNPI